MIPWKEMVSVLDLLFPRHVTSNDQPAPASKSQQATGKDVQEVSYQEGSQDKITHTESTGFHFIEQEVTFSDVSTSKRLWNEKLEKEWNGNKT